eukprot:4760110-Amphidinium_carterae.1
MKGALRVLESEQLDGLSPESYLHDVNPPALPQEHVEHFRSCLVLPASCRLVRVSDHGRDHLLHVVHSLWEQDLKTGGLRNRQTVPVLRDIVGNAQDCSSGA